MREEEEKENETKTTNLEAPAALHITGKSGVCECVCMCVPSGLQELGLSGEVFCINFQGHSTHLWVRTRSWTSQKKKKSLGEEERGGEVKERDKESVLPFSYHPLLLHICSSPVPWGKRERESPPKKKNKEWKKEKQALWSPCTQRKERVREGKLQKAN